MQMGGKLSAKRLPGGRAPAKGLKKGRTVSEEITVLVNTLRELAAIRATAEDAAGRILDSAEGLLAFADKDEAKKAEEAILAIMTACGFRSIASSPRACRPRRRTRSPARLRRCGKARSPSSKAPPFPAQAIRNRRGSTLCSATIRLPGKRRHGGDRPPRTAGEKLGKVARIKRIPPRLTAAVRGKMQAARHEHRSNAKR
jgi:hypothetical protein